MTMSAKVLLAAILFSNGTKCLATKLHFVFLLSFSCPEFLYCGASQKMSDSFGLQTNPFQQHIVCQGLFHLLQKILQLHLATRQHTCHYIHSLDVLAISQCCPPAVSGGRVCAGAANAARVLRLRSESRGLHASSWTFHR